MLIDERGGVLFTESTEALFAFFAEQKCSDLMVGLTNVASREEDRLFPVRLEKAIEPLAEIVAVTKVRLGEAEATFSAFHIFRILRPTDPEDTKQIERAGNCVPALRTKA